MAGLINRFGTQPTASSGPAGRGPGNNRGGQGRRGGGGNGGNGGGAGGGGRNRIPNTGLYFGRAGEGQANINPDAYFRAVTSRLGGLSYSGTPVSDFSEEFAAKLRDDYLAAQATRQRLSPVDYLRQTYGAGFRGRKGREFGAGTLGMQGGAMQGAYDDWFSGKDPTAFLTGRAAGQGGFAPGGGNQDFQTWYQTAYAPSLLAELEGARAGGDPTLTLNDLVAGRDLVGQARRRYLARPNAQRQIGPANAGARWSVWD